MIDKKSIKVAIQQPNFFPWLGYFECIDIVDIYVFLDDVAFGSKPKRMNRNFISVILGGWGESTGTSEKIEGEMVPIEAESVSSSLKDCNSVIIVPGYGMAVAQAQSSIAELTKRLRKKIS